MSTLLQKLWSSPTVADVMQNWQDRPIFKGKGDDAPAWLARFEAGCEERKLSEKHWVEAADFCMEENPKLRLMEVQKTMTELVVIPGFKWDWRTYRHAVLNIPWNMPRSMKLNLQFLQQFKDMFKKFDKPNPPPQPEPHTITKDDPSMAQYALSFVPGFGFWLPDLLNSDPSPPVEPATPTKVGKGKEKKDKNKDATTGSTKKKEAPKPSVSPKDPGKRQEAIKSPEAPKDPGAGSLSRFRTLIPSNKAKGTPTEIREAALTVLWAKCSSPETRKKAVQDLLSTLEKWLVTVCVALLDLYDTIKPVWTTIESTLQFGSTTSIPLPYKEFIAAAYMLMAGAREKIESVRPVPQRSVTL